MASIPLALPDISQADIDAVVSVLRTPQLSLGPQLPAFEEQFAAYVGTKHAVAVSSGTSALHLCMRALDINDGDEVITTPFSFIASANCILFERAVPVFADVLPDTLCIDPNQIEAAITPRTKAILPVDVFGYLPDWNAIRAIAEQHNLAIIEDSCEALGSSQAGVKAGAFGDCGVFGFYPNKQMTTGEGGMLVTDREDIAQPARAMRNQGRAPESGFLEHEHLGFNYRISDINCALGISQLKRIDEFVAARAQVAQWYAEGLAPLADAISPPPAQPGVDISWFVYVVRLAEQFTAAQRDQLLQYLREHDIGCSNYFPSIHLQPLYRTQFGFAPGAFPVAEAASERVVALPFHTQLTREAVGQVCATLEAGIAHIST